MATKLYFRDAANALTGTFPSGRQSSLSATHLSSKASVLRTLNTAAGTSQVIASFSSTTTTALQTNFFGFFCSDTLDVNQTVGDATEKVEFSIGNFESNLSMNLGAASSYKLNLYVWRPSSGSIVGRVLKNLAVTGTVEPNTGTAARSNNGSTTGTTSIVSALAGDVLICEVFQAFSEAFATVYEGRYYYDGTTETLTDNSAFTSIASFINFQNTTLTFGTPSAGGTASGAFSTTLDAAVLSAAGSIGITGQANKTLQNATLTATATEKVTGQANKTLQDATLSATAKDIVTGNLSTTLPDATLSAAGTANNSFIGTKNATLDNATFSASGNVKATGQFNSTLDNVVFSGSGAVRVTGAANITANNATISASGIAQESGIFNVTLAAATVSGVGTVLAASIPAPIVLAPVSTNSGNGQRRKFKLPDLEAEWGKGPDEIFGKPDRPQPPQAPQAVQAAPSMTITKIIGQVKPQASPAVMVTPQTPQIVRKTTTKEVDDTEEIVYMLLAALM